MVAAILERGGARARPQPRRARTWPAASRARCCRPRAAAARLAGDTRALRGRRVLARPGRRRAASRARSCSRNLFRDQLDRYGELETIADRWAERRARARRRRARPQRRRPAGRRPRPRTRRREDACYFGVEDDALALREMQHAADAKHCRRCGAAVPLRRRLPRPSRPLPLRQLRRAAPGRRGRGATRRRARGASARARVHAAHAGRRARASAPAPRPLQRLQRARGRRAVRSRWAPARRRRAGLRGRRARVRPGRDASRLGEPRALDPAREEPGRRERGPAHARARARRARPARRSSTTRSPTGATSRWIWDADFEVLAGARAPRDLQRHARGRAGAAAEVRGRRARAHRGRRAALDERRSTARSRDRRRPRCTRCRPTPRCSGCASCSSPAARRGAASRERAPRTDVPEVIWHDLECGAYGEDLPLWRDLADGGTAGRCSTSAPARAASRSTSPAQGHASSRSTVEPDLLAALRARRGAGLPIETVVADARDVRRSASAASG